MFTGPTRGLAALLVAACASGTAAAQLTPEQQAEAILNTARKAYNEGDPRFAAEKFTELLNKFGNAKCAADARYGLGLALLDLPDRNYQKSLEVLTPVANDAKFPDRARALYYAGVCQRGLGQKEIAEGVAKPNELQQRKNNAGGNFKEALRLFGKAREAFEKKGEAEWAARARCDAAEMQLRLDKTKEARAAVEPFVKDAKLTKSKFRPLGLYYHGTACFLLKDTTAAAKSLAQLAPFDQPFGPHARYLVGRIHGSEGESAKAAAAFDAVVAEYAKQKAAAVASLKQPEKFKNDPWEKARLEALARNPAPDYVAGSAFYGACLKYDAGKFGEAREKFEAFARDYSSSPLKDDAALRLGFCQVHEKQFEQAAKTLVPLTMHQRLADQALYWTGKARAGQAAAVGLSNSGHKNFLYEHAINSLRAAADSAKQSADRGDVDAKARRAEALLELADTQLAAKREKDAAATCESIWSEKLLPAKAEEMLQRLITAYHLAGEFQKSDERIADFKQQFPKSALLPFVLFRGAENAYARAEGLAKKNKPAEAKTAFTEAGKKYAEVASKFPEFERINLARYGQALCHIAAEDYGKAIKLLEAVPAAERVGDLAPVPYVLADCHLRAAPAKAEDAGQDQTLREKITVAAGLLDGFISANPKAEQTPDAILKLGYCHKRLAVQLPPGHKRDELLRKARTAFEKVSSEFKESSAFGAANLERAKVMALQGDKGGAINVLRGFASDPLQKSPAAPLAYIYLAALLREQNQSAEAAKLLQQARQKFEGGLTAQHDAECVALLRYHHGVALLESNKAGEARAAFEQSAKSAPKSPIAVEATLREAQCQAEERRRKVEELQKQKRPGMPPEQVANIDNQIKALQAELVGVAKLFERRAEDFRKDHRQSESRARMLYDAAWAYREAGADAIPAYTKLIEQFPDLSLSIEARLELAELLADKDKLDEAVKLLKAALDAKPADRPPPPEMIERIRIRLGVALVEKKEYDAAKSHFDAVGGNENSPHRAQGLYRSGECLLAQGKADEAQKKLAIFRDNGQFHNVAGVSDRAMLRLGHALAQLKQWDAARQAFETVINRFGSSNPWTVDARYGIAWSFQSQGRYDDAVRAYSLVTQATTDDRAGRSHLQIGLCRAAQKRWADAGRSFAAVYYGYDLPDLKFPALIEHARVLIEENKTAEAVKLLDRVVKDAPKDGEWSKAAQERLGKVKK